MDPRRPDPQDLELALTVAPSMVTPVRRFVEALVERLGADADFSGRTALTVHELIENVAKYADDNHALLRLQYLPYENSSSRLTISVTNSASPPQIQRLQQVFRDMAAQGGPIAHYFALMQRPVGNGESGLGLARIRAEAHMHLALTLDDSRVSIQATSLPSSAADVVPLWNELLPEHNLALPDAAAPASPAADDRSVADPDPVRTGLLDLLLEGAGDGLFEWDLANDTIKYSPRWKMLFGYEDHELADLPSMWRTLSHPDDLPRVDELLRDHLDRVWPFSHSWRMRHRNGEWRWILCRATSVRDRAGAPAKLLALFTDINDHMTEQRRLEGELRIAAHIQTSLLPAPASIEHLELAYQMLPATEVGGDYFDVRPCHDGAWVAIGDVSGHGLNAGLMMLMVQSAIACLVTENPDASPAAVLRTVNRVLHQNIHGRLKSDEYITLTLLRYFNDGRFLFAGAHEDILIVRAADGRVDYVPTPGIWLGAIADLAPHVPETWGQLYPGDLLVLYTDGITEARNAAGAQLGVQPLAAAVSEVRDRPVDQIRDHVHAVVTAWTKAREDDMSLVVARYR